MRNSSPPGPVIALLGTGLAATCALVFSWGLAAVARPADLQARLAALRDQAETAQTLLRRRGGFADYPPGAVCPGLSDLQLEPVRQRLSTTIAGGGLSVQKISVTPMQDADLEPIRAVQVQLEASGRYETALLALDSLSRLTPLIYVDTVDLKTNVDTVNLQLSGRFYCWTAAPR
ncbi:MAG: hypothetical protein JF570_02165 [Caulobacter sp.]|nr:hypothetical protein [Caulobacter sp.]